MKATTGESRLATDPQRIADVENAPRIGWRLGGGLLFGAGCVVLFLVLWGSVLIGKRVMVGGDVLFLYAPWAGTPGPHPAPNSLVSDGIDSFLPWLTVIRQSFAAGRLPLWNPYVLFGAPLLANGQAAPFSPFTLFAVLIGGAWGMSLAMLAKLWIAGAGTYVFLRRLGVGGLGAVLGGLAFATSSFMIIWLHGQGSSVAALLPWVFAAAEWYIQAPRGRRLALLAAAIGLQFLGGQPDSSLYLCLGVAIYGIVRCAPRSHRAALAGLVAAAIVGVLVASAQLVPFAAYLKQSGAVGARATADFGGAHLPLTHLTNWLVPNLHGNPALDHAMSVTDEINYLSTGFAGVTALILAVPGLVFQWKRDRSISIALALVGLVSVGGVYGPLDPIFARLPVFSSASSPRMVMLGCFVIASLGGVGLDGLARRRLRVGLSLPGLSASVLGFAALGAALVGAILLGLRGGAVSSLGPALPHGWITFWVAFGAVSFLGATGLAIAAWSGARRPAVTGLAVLALVEAAVFAGPYQPQLPPSQVPPHSAAVNWLVAHAGDRTVAAAGADLLPETAALYGLHDARGYEHTQSPRVDLFWSHADPGFSTDPEYTATMLSEPGAQWLAAAGVAFYMTSGDVALPGTVMAYQGEGVTISRVPDVRPFAFAASSVRWVGSPEQAANGMSTDPLASVYLEGSGPQQEGQATVAVISRQPGHVELDVDAAQAADVVLLQSYATGWKATVDGRQTKVIPADVLFQAVRVPAGQHRVVLEYRPSSVPLGLGLTGAGGLLIVLLLVLNPELSSFRRFGRKRLGPASSR